MEKLGNGLLAVIAAAWTAGMVAGMVRVFPYGILGLSGIGTAVDVVLLVKVPRERRRN